MLLTNVELDNNGKMFVLK